MGWHLWTSPVTGYRRRGTQLAELRAHFEDAITASAILEPLKSCPLYADACSMSELLKQRDFDVAGVQESPQSPTMAYVRQEDLTKGGQVGDHLRHLEPAVLIADSTPLAELFAVLAPQQFAFVMIGAEVRGVITQWDLNKPPVRIHLFGILSLLEMHLNFWIRTELGEGWFDRLPRGRQRAALRLRSKKPNGHEADLIDCVTFGDKTTLARESPQVLARAGLRGEDIDLLESARELRNDLAHANESLAQGRSWADLSRTVQWLESVLRHSDEQIEQEAVRLADGYDDPLWASA